MATDIRKSESPKLQREWTQVTNDAVENIVKLYSDPAVEGYVRLKTATECIDKFYSECLPQTARLATMTFMNLCYKELSIIKDLHPNEITRRICSRYEFYLKQKFQDPEQHEQVASSEIPDNLWEACFEQAINFKVPKHALPIDILFRVRNPENERRAFLIIEDVRSLLDNEDKFQYGVGWISAFNLQRLKEEQFDTIVYKAHIINAVNVFDIFLVDRDERLRYLKVLDGCLERVLDYKDFENQYEPAFIKTVGKWKLAGLIAKQARKFNIDINELNFRAHRTRVISDIRYKFLHDNRATFEPFASDALRERNMDYKIEFINMLSKDSRYAYCWAKYLKIPRCLLPISLKQLDKNVEAEAKQFVESMERRCAIVEAEDTQEECNIFGKSYTLYTIATPEGLKKFIQNHFTDSKPEVIGLDCEAGSFATGTSNKVTVLQIATKEWLCLVDVHILSKHLSDKDWTEFFTHIFHPETVRVGFAFASDYAFIFGAFPHLLPLLQEENRKVLCISKLVQAILTNYKAEKAVFPEKIPMNLSLADVCDAAMGYKLNKEMQSSNWTQRPLTQEQKIYAVTDALVVVLIKEKMENDLKNNLDEVTYTSIMNEGYICRVAKVKTEKKEGCELDSSVKTKKTLDFCDISEHALKVSNELKEEFKETISQLDVHLILDAPFFNLFTSLHNLGIDAFDVRIKGVNNQKQQILVIDEELKNNPTSILVTTERRRKEFPSVSSNAIDPSRILLMPTTGEFIALNYITRVLRTLKIVIDEKYFFTRCEKCSSQNLRTIPSPLYVLVYYIYLVIKKLGFRFSVSMLEIEKAAMDVKKMMPSDYNDFEAKVHLENTSKTLPEIIIDTKDYIIKPLSCQIILKGNDSAIFTFKPSGSTFFASKPGINHIVCIDCGHIYHKEDSKEVIERVIAGKASYQLTEVFETDGNETRMKIIGIIRKIFTANNEI